MGANDCCCGQFDAAVGTKIIAIASMAISVVSIIGLSWRLVELEIAKDELNILQILNSPEAYQAARELTDLVIKFLGVTIGVAAVCLLVAVALFFAVRKRSSGLCLPFMIWTIVLQIAVGLVSCILIFYCAVTLPNAANSDQLTLFIRTYAVPLIFSIIMFVLNTWWLIVVFAYYRLLKSGHAFDSIPMQTA